MDGVFKHGTPGLCNELKHTTYSNTPGASEYRKWCIPLENVRSLKIYGILGIP